MSGLSSAEARQLFPGTAQGTCLDTANFGLLAAPVAEAASRTLAGLTEIPERGATTRYLELEAEGDGARREVALLVGARPSEIALVESTSHGLQVAAAALPVKPGDEVVTAAWDFLGIPLTWQTAAERGQIRLRQVDLRGTADPTARLIDALQPATRALCTTSVTEAHGARLLMADLARARRERDVWLVLDVMQEAGVRRLDLHAAGVDLAAAGGHKWLGCPFGCGFLII